MDVETRKPRVARAFTDFGAIIVRVSFIDAGQSIVKFETP
jgi:hypothetical protein